MNIPVHETNRILCYVHVVTKSNVVDTKQCFVLAAFGKEDMFTSPALVWVDFGHEIEDDPLQMSD